MTSLPGGIPRAILGEAPGPAVFVVLAPSPAQTRWDSDRYFTVTSESLSSAPGLDLGLRGKEVC